jgi:hypothetical protein
MPYNVLSILPNNRQLLSIYRTLRNAIALIATMRRTVPADVLNEQMLSHYEALGVANMGYLLFLAGHVEEASTKFAEALAIHGRAFKLSSVGSRDARPEGGTNAVAITTRSLQLKDRGSSVAIAAGAWCCAECAHILEDGGTSSAMAMRNCSEGACTMHTKVAGDKCSNVYMSAERHTLR